MCVCMTEMHINKYTLNNHLQGFITISCLAGVHFSNLNSNKTNYEAISTFHLEITLQVEPNFKLFTADVLNKLWTTFQHNAIQSITVSKVFLLAGLASHEIVHTGNFSKI